MSKRPQCSVKGCTDPGSGTPVLCEKHFQAEYRHDPASVGSVYDTDGKFYCGGPEHCSQCCAKALEDAE